MPTERQIEREFIQAFIALGLTMAEAEKKFAELIAAGQLEAALAAFGLDGPITAKAAQSVVNTYLEAGQKLLDDLPLPKDELTGARIKGFFHGTLPEARAWTEKTVARLVTEVMDEQRAMIREVVAQGIRDGVNPAKLVRQIVGIPTKSGGRSGGIIGLTSRQAEAVYRARTELQLLNDNYFSRTMRDKRFDGLVRKAIAEGKPLPAAKIEEIVARYASKSLDYRGMMVAQTEYHSAVEAGKFDSMAAMISSGRVKPQNVTIEWDSSGDKRVRTSHRRMDGQSRPWGELFQTPEGYFLAYPGDITHGAPGAETIHCRCVMDVKINRFAGLS